MQFWKVLLILVLGNFIMTAFAGVDNAINFVTFEPTTAPKTYLVCDKQRCPKAYEIMKADRLQTSPVFNMNVAKVKQSFDNIVTSKPRTLLIAQFPEIQQYVYQQRTRVFRFPDIITVQYLPISDQQTSIIIYSYAKHGYYDFGVNPRRVKVWLKELKQEIPGP